MYFIDKNNKVVANYVTLKLEETGEIYIIYTRSSLRPVLEEGDLAVGIGESWYEYGNYTIIDSKSSDWPVGKTISRLNY